MERCEWPLLRKPLDPTQPRQEAFEENNIPFLCNSSDVVLIGSPGSIGNDVRGPAAARNRACGRRGARAKAQPTPGPSWCATTPGATGRAVDGRAVVLRSCCGGKNTDGESCDNMLLVSCEFNPSCSTLRVCVWLGFCSQ